ncbi:FecR family protein [Nubsella zeaxanthinifaciens]|uniref:FecR family protein n=1 Tax=Nubsella zeaxanthinifaciens TaxID=392412 RepID=UPI000DE27E77|nr:FecR family protein [Nubsella zeaxanthinifaciens]
MKAQQDINELFRKYIDQTITAPELMLLNAMVHDQAQQQKLDGLLEQHFSNHLTDSEQLSKQSNLVKNLAWESIHQRINQPVKRASIAKLWWFRVAAAILVMISLTLYFFNTRKDTDKLQLSIAADIQPGGNKAILKSSNGFVYNLSGKKGEIIVDNDNIHYEDGVILKNEDENEIITLSTPRGGQYKVTLSDGTKVWLNAESSIIYPTNFAENERKVQLVGEAYFEVTHNPKQPFIVATKSQNIKVLGTSFNVNAYKNDTRTITTLLSGSVQLNKKDNNPLAKLIPGQQAVLNNDNVAVENVDATVFSAWKDGEFRFKASSLVDVLRQIERWYDVDVDYTNVPAEVYIHASINRNRQLSTVLNALEKITNLKFQVKGRSIQLMR